jgi:thiol-disulfide isomerase/thioredoxin
MPFRPFSVHLFLLLWALASPASGRVTPQNGASQDPASKSSAKPPVPEEQLQQAIHISGNDRAALVRNLEAFLKEYPDTRQRPQIYRALVEASLQLRDDARAAGYAERIIALNPEDISMTILAIQLLERGSEEAALRRATNYATRVLEFVERSSPAEKSPKISQAEWALENKSDRMNILAMRGRLELKLQDTAAAQRDFEASYAILPGAIAAEQLGEIAELKKDLNAAIQQYARAFALAEATTGTSSRREIRPKLGNAWRLAHRSDDGLGEYLLRTYDEISQASLAPKPRKNAGAREPADFTLRKAPDGAEYPLKDTKGKVLVINFWATWCGPCHTLEPMFSRVSSEFLSNTDALFLAADCDEDESLVKAYLESDKFPMPVVFADGLDRFFAVNSFPTVLVVDRAGKIAYRSDGFAPDSFESELAAAVRSALAPLSAASPGQKPAP